MRREGHECLSQEDILRSTSRSLAPALALLIPGALAAQDSTPANLAEVELARSRACVPALADLAELEASMEPFTRRVDRLNMLGRAVSLEKRQDAEPFDNDDPMEASVARWFSADSALAVRFLEEGDSTILTQRTAARTEVLDRLRMSIQDVSTEAQASLDNGAAVQAAAEPCLGAILIRSAVLEECAGEQHPVCEAAAAEELQQPFLFVDAADDLWDVEQYGPWGQPAPIQIGPNGEIDGANTSARARIGNVGIQMTLRPLIRPRSEMSEEEAAQYQENLDSLGFTFDHPTLAMAPAIDLQGTLPPPLGGETHYLLHFGDLSGDDIIWSMEAAVGGPLRAVFPARSSDLARLRAGETVSFSAIRAPDEEGSTGEAVFTLSLLQVGQIPNVGTLLDYLSDGSFNQDLRTLFPSG